MAPPIKFPLQVITEVSPSNNPLMPGLLVTRGI
jgi:hypothetical protein